MKTIQLREDTNITYYLTSITEKQKEQLFEIKFEYKDNKDKQEELFKKLSIKWGIWCSGILKIGEVSTTKSAALSSYIETFKGRDIEGKGSVGWNREVHYRNYKIPVEKQKDRAWIINQCSERSASVRTVLQMMDKKWCILWELYNSNKLKKIMNKQLKDTTCYIKNY